MHHLASRLLLFGGLALCAGSLACNAASGAEGGAADEQLATLPPSPDIQFDELKHDFGEVMAGAVAEHTFRFTNRGKGVLQLEKPRGS